MTESATLAEVFDELADSYDHGHHEEIARALIAWADPGATARVADVACGAGAVALQVARGRPDTAPAVLAVDLSPGMVATGRERSVGLVPVGAIDWRVADAVPLPVPDHSLDVVLCASSLHFLGRRVMDDWLRALRPGGRVGFTLPLATHFRPSERFTRHISRDVPLPRTAREADAWATACGFSGAASRILDLGARRVAVIVASAPAGS
ncbi:class I SAM-dependent methyltransferase [Streptomyces collinus]|uniref:class I SAM-dependent methyltransferase n=1 Tax=Streptomyces collinus TaxID=42684 RepID=UPI0036CE2AB9